MPDGAGSDRKRRRRTGVASDVARAIREAPDAAGLVMARRRVVQHLADALEEAMRVENTLLVVKLNAQLEQAVRRAGLEVDDERPAGGVPDGGSPGADRSLDDELAELAAREPALGDPAAS